MLTHEKNTVQLLPEFLEFAKTVSLRETLSKCCKSKQGISLFDIFCTLFTLVFRQRNFWRWSVSEKNTPPFGRDTVYRFLSSPYHNWRRFLTRIALSVIAFLAPLTEAKKRKVFVVDDSVYDKSRSKKLELLSKIYDHVEQKYVRGFRMLTLAFTDGTSLIPLDFALLGSQKRLCEANPDIDRRSHGSKRRAEAISKAPAVLLSMLKTHRDVIQDGSHIVFDSWFSFPSLICAISGQKLHVTCRLKDNDTRYLFRRNGKDSLVTIEQLHAKLSRIPSAVRERQRKENADILGSLRVILPCDDGEAVNVKIVFVENKSSKKANEWIALLTTDLELSEEEVVQMYAKRWKIEEFFKVSKSLLQLEREFQGRSYDMLVGHATLVCVRYMFLELERRRTLDIRTCGELFYYCCDELPDLSIREAVLRIFQTLKNFFTNFSTDGKDIFKACVEYFIAALPPHLLNSLPVLLCES